jgi:hypothetical protein
MSDEESELARTVLHVAGAKRIVAQQHARIAKLKAAGHPTADHEQLLDLFVRTLEAFKDHERLLLREIAEKRRVGGRTRR